MDGEQRRSLPCQSLGHLQQPLGDGERDDPDGCYLLPRRHRDMGGQGGDGQRLVQQVHPVHRGGIHHQQAGGFRRQFDPARGGAGAGEQRPAYGIGQAVGGLVRRHLAGFRPGDDHMGMACRFQRSDRRMVEHGARLQHPVVEMDGVGKDGAARLPQRGGAEDHAAVAGAARRARLAPRRVATISARMERAISGAVTASILRPMGAWIRAMAASPCPISCRRATRFA